MKSLKTILLGLLTVGAFSAQAEYLYWQMDWADADDLADYATLVVLDASGHELDPSVVLELANPSPLDSTKTKVVRDIDANDQYSDESVQVTSIINSTHQSDAYTFALRTYDERGNLLETFGPTPYADIAGSIWNNPPMSPGASTTWSPTKYAVPEPATGTLFILGSLMLFRRKRA